MTSDELGKRAQSMLAELDARQPGGCAGSLAGLSIAEAYSLQQAVSRLRELRGEHVIGYKIGCVSRAIQKQLGVGQPVFGRVFDTGAFPSSSRLSLARFADLAIEGELAIRLSRDLPGTPLSDDDYIAAIGSVFPVIELHHYRVTSTGGGISALIATSGMHAGLIPSLEETSTSDGVPPVRELVVRIDDELVGATMEPWAMGGPAAVLRWLSLSLNEVGARLLCGQVVLTGSVLPLYPVRPGARVVVEARPLLGSSVIEIDH